MILKSKNLDLVSQNHEIKSTNFNLSKMFDFLFNNFDLTLTFCFFHHEQCFYSQEMNLRKVI